MESAEFNKFCGCVFRGGCYKYNRLQKSVVKVKIDRRSKYLKVLKCRYPQSINLYWVIMKLLPDGLADKYEYLVKQRVLGQAT